MLFVMSTALVVSIFVPSPNLCVNKAVPVSSISMEGTLVTLLARIQISHVKRTVPAASGALD